MVRSSGKGKESRCLVFTSSKKREIRQFHVVVFSVTARKCTKMRDARAELLFRQSKPIAVLPFSLRSPSSLLKVARLDFLGGYLPTLSINYFGMSKDMGKRLPQLYYIKRMISYDLGFIASGVTMAT